MAAKKGSKKDKKHDKDQTSLFSFVEKEKQEKKIEKKEVLEKKKEKIIEKQIEKLDDTISKKRNVSPIKKKEEEIKKIPEKLFYKKNITPFGLKEGDIKLDKVMRESVTSKYLRYLIKKGDITKNLEKGLLFDVDYDGGLNKAYCKFYDLDTDEIKIWIDTTEHSPYCITKTSKDKLENNIKLTEYEGFEGFEEIKKFDLLNDKEITMTKIHGKTPTNIGGAGLNIKNILKESGYNAWEADIRYHINYIFDMGLIPGMIYSIKNGTIKKEDFHPNKEDYNKMEKELISKFKDESKELKIFNEENIDIFLTPIPDLKRLALDIEIKLGPDDYTIPDPGLAKQEIISISFVANDGLKQVYVLERKGYSYKKNHEKFPNDAKVVYFKNEKDLLIETFRLIWEYPIIITFNGDNFDLNYLFHRANRFKIDRDLNPIHVKRGFGMLARRECELRKGIHIDIFNFFINRSISGYAFGGAYQRGSLNAISSALLGKEKYVHEEEIHDMEYDALIWYNLKDSILTLDLTKFNNNLVWNLIILLCRITKMPIHEVIRRQISTWVQNIFYFEHRRKNYLIPRRSEISELKKGGHSKSIIEGKRFQGAYVITPVPGIHFDVVVMDFACYSDDTEILTNDGWYKYYNLKNHKKNHIKVATINPKDNNIEYNTVSEFFDYEYKGKMINFKQHGIDILVTPNHRMVYNKRTNKREITNFEKKINIKTANELKEDYLYAIPYTGNWKGKDIYIHIGDIKYNPPDFLPFLGWFITDGGISGRSVNIYQSKEHNFDHIRSSLEKLGLPYKEYVRNRPGKKPEK
ncbi:MAG: hypothetical protein KGD57_00995, partial [Candidatus Lokiarchaeota archaeon]|nr:hypothetical protein [Candidatus Lokiarchaeota archaeon]